MSERGEASARHVRQALEEVRRLRERGARARLGRNLAHNEEVPPPPGGWKPILDDEGNVIADPPPAEPTDYHGEDQPSP